MSFIQGLSGNTVFMIFLTLVLGYAFGRINFAGVKFGTSGVLIVALIFGALGMQVPAIVGTAGLALFLACVGLSAGPSFITNLKANFWGFLATTAAILVSAGGTVALAVKVFKLPLDLALGVMAGAMTSTASLATTKELFGDQSAAGVGYGLAYVFGIISVVMFVQLVPKLLKADIEAENAKLPDPPVSKSESDKSLLTVDGPGVFVVCVAIALGALIGAVELPLGGGASFSLGTGGGAIIAGIVVSVIGHCGKIKLTAPKSTLVPLRDLGIAWFLLQNGAGAGPKFVSTLQQYGIMLFLVGALMSCVSILLAYIVARYLCKMPLFGALGATTGAMTSAPSLNALITVTGNDKAASFYAACQPIATVGLVILPKLLVAMLGS